MAQSTHHRHYQAFLRLLRSLRVDANVTQAELGSRVGNTQTFVSKVERGERRLDVVEFVEWCEALGLRPETVLEAYISKRKQPSLRARKLPAQRRQT